MHLSAGQGHRLKIAGSMILEEFQVDQMRVYVVDGILGDTVSRRRISRRHISATIRKAGSRGRSTAGRIKRRLQQLRSG
jgi:ribosome biogenesis SPOUT family RNA methylase Rps3